MRVFCLSANRRNESSPIVGIKFRQSSEKPCKRRRDGVYYGQNRERGACMKPYRKRIADEILKRKLEGKGAVLIEGPKWCGKTTTAEQAVDGRNPAAD